MALVLMIPVTLCYCELCSMLLVFGGEMIYAFRAFGDTEHRQMPFLFVYHFIVEESMEVSKRS